MAEMLLIDTLKELRTLIDQQHLLYLELDENPRKIDQRNKLESYIKEYLCLAPHDSKFTCHHTANVLYQSASTKNNFSAYKAAVAWKAIGKYADNLISHPWRKEYRYIKLYCGFYKHEIEENLVGAELMFEAMGYRHAGHSCMVLPGIIDPDRITSVSKDAIIAFVECQIMKQIWETLSSHLNISWLEILEFRENHTGTPDQVIRTLTYKHRQRQYQEQIYHKPHYQTIESHPPAPECPCGQNSMGYYNQSPYLGQSYSYRVQSRYGPLVSPQQIVPSSLCPNVIHPSYSSSHPMLKPQDIYPVNGYHMNSHYAPQMSLHVPSNGYPVVPIMYSVPSIVPTGQLIELDSSPTHNTSDAYLQTTSNPTKYHSSQEELVRQDCLKNDGPTLTRKAKDDGAGSWENWDSVYRTLESQKCKREQESPNENQPSSSQNNSSEIDIETDFSGKLRQMNLDSNTQTSIDLDGESRSSSSVKEKSKIETEKSRDLEKIKIENKTKISPKKESTRKSSDPKFSSKSQEYLLTSKDSIKPKKSNEETKYLVVNLDNDEEKWQCITCTFLNSPTNTVCEMCCKSRERGNELNPQPSGGAECPKCTLVNEPGLANCAACNSSLKDSPTYI